MGRQAYLNRLALGRSPYELPETATVDPSSPVRRVSHIHADSYMQQYDSRGHPVNPESKSLGRALRKAKNDILSTMGIVVSGEDRSASSSNEQQRINQITAENDFGLVITTADQLFVFFGSWWTSSLTGEIQTFRHYTHAALLDVIRSERGTTGILGFYFAGIPAWAVSSGLAIARDNPWKRTWTAIRDYVVSITGNGSLSLAVRAVSIITYFTARSSLLVLSVEAYMYSILQTLSIIPPKSIPSLRLLIPFGGESLIRLPDLPTDLSAPAITGFLLRLLASPAVLTFIYAFYLRPALEERIYRLIRRQVPKPVLADELSIRVAFEENLVEWVVPTLGRRADEEARRAKLTLLQDMQCELVAFREWLFSFFGLFSSNTSSQKAMEASSQERIENLRNSIESLRHELEEVQLRNDPAEDGLVAPFTRPPGPMPRRNTIDLGQAGLATLPEGTSLDDGEMRFGIPQVLTNENRMSQSPGEMSNDFFSEMATIGRTSAPSQSTVSNTQSLPSNSQQAEVTSRGRQNSRSNTLFSRPSSPETSPPTSPRVRASLIHQSSDIITMQLELLGNRTRTARNPASVSSSHIPRLGTNNAGLRRSSTVDRRSIADFLEALILSQAQQQAAQSPTLGIHDGPSNINAEPNLATGHDAHLIENEPPNGLDDGETMNQELVGHTAGEISQSVVQNILPDGVEEPSDIDAHPLPPSAAIAATQDLSPEVIDQPDAPTSQIPASSAYPSSNAHRVTLLSAHPVDSLASHLAAILSNLILAPLESLCYRSLAHSYLATHASSTAQLTNLHPLNLWFGGISWVDIGAYTGRLILMRGMQAALRAGVWGFLVGSTMRIGRKFCGWGTL
ncbi:hypothetical protein N7509_002598 [Penicillium cosmopolitanum]|uniref:Uncharacterized protein n=1 Tax=Penicillium cosmopolitanum TaxID=1131564 RepID=A0A9W9W9Q2_9EURO|nr:uncharacterized protein N7509_002598 [Penicillium cosmopolitanum]KAJ5408715.1 hypothetical protein N7509_002598 [Penicillium cosmopolitanum]